MKAISTQIVAGLSLSVSVLAATSAPVPGSMPPPPQGAGAPNAGKQLPPPTPNVAPPSTSVATKPPVAPPAAPVSGGSVTSVSKTPPPVGATPPPPNQTPPNVPPGQLGNPPRAAVALAGISAAQLTDFLSGQEDFVKEETAATGLGPIFNDVSCVACHNAGGAGGAGRKTVVRFGRVTNGVFDPLTELGGSLLQKRAINAAALEHIPKEANVIAMRITTPLFGAGLIEAIPDAAILANVDVPKTDGVKGRAAMITDPVSGQTRVGRFGWKAQHSSLLGFSADAYLNEMGITNRFFPTENAPNGNAALLARFDKFADPEDVADTVTNKADIDKVADFMRLLAPLPTGTVTDKVTAGKAAFAQVGCVQCHVPKMITGTDGPVGTQSKDVMLYSDLLLHDMGTLGDGIAQGPASMKEMRTSPLWGLRARDRYLHDGRATTVDLAIRAHDGEAKVIRDKYLALPAAQRSALLEFLKSI